MTHKTFFVGILLLVLSIVRILSKNFGKSHLIFFLLISFFVLLFKAFICEHFSHFIGDFLSEIGFQNDRKREVDHIREQFKINGFVIFVESEPSNPCEPKLGQTIKELLHFSCFVSWQMYNELEGNHKDQNHNLVCYKQIPIRHHRFNSLGQVHAQQKED